MNLKETLAAGLIGVSTLAGCGDEADTQCGTGIQNISLETWEKVWDHCAATAQVGMLENKDSYVMCSATCTDSPKGCERKYTCEQIWNREDVDGQPLNLKTLNNCTGNGVSVCTEKLDK